MSEEALITDTERDGLTGLSAANHARKTLSAWIAGQEVDEAGGAEQGQKPGLSIHVMLLGLGRFDTVNLAFGKAAGDGVLIEVARRIMHFADDEFAEERIEGADWCAARLSGGQFLLMARSDCSHERWQFLCEALADAVAHPIAALDTGGGAVRLWPRVAMMEVGAGQTSSEIFERLAGAQEMLREKQGRRMAWVDGEMAVIGARNAQLEADLLSAIDRDEIAIRYQPLVDLADGTIVGAEALARWHHPQLGRIGAGPLFAIAEQADHIAQLSRHIAQRALNEASKWPPHLRLSLNVTSSDLAASSFVSEFGDMLERSGFAPDRLTLEITEHVLVSDLALARRSLAQLKQSGVRIALDDFGAGFCNFRYLKMLPLDYLKLDRAMIDGIAHDEQDLAVMRAIIAMAKALNLELIAEGVESEAQRSILAQEGCTLFQGFLEAPPLESTDFIERAASIENPAEVEDLQP